MYELPKDVVLYLKSIPVPTQDKNECIYKSTLSMVKVVYLLTGLKVIDIDEIYTTPFNYEKTKPGTFLMGEGGLACLDARLGIISNNLCKKIILRFNDARRLSDNELLYGKAGHIYTLLYYYKYIQQDKDVLSEAETLMDVMLSEIVVKNSYLLRTSWHCKEYVGAAHGYIGILFVLIFAYSLLPRRIQIVDIIKANVEYIIKNDFVDGGVRSSRSGSPHVLWHWCHGTPGLLPLISAYNMYIGEMKEFVALCSRYVLENGVLRTKGLGLCHSTCGNGLLLINANLSNSLVAQMLEFSVANFSILRVQADHPNSLMDFSCADLCDTYGDDIEYVEPIFRRYGKLNKLAGKVKTVKCHEDNSMVKQILNQPNHDNSVLVVDGGGSNRRALVGDLIAKSAIKNGWKGILVYGYIRDVEIIDTLDICIMALGSHPRKTVRKDVGEIGVIVKFGGVTFDPTSSFVYGDSDGLVVSNKVLC